MGRQLELPWPSPCPAQKPEAQQPLNIVALSRQNKLVAEQALKFEDFDIGATVGVGATGRVCVAKIKGSRDGAPLALKIMKKSTAIRQKYVRHIMDEVVILSQIEHPFIVNLLAAFQDERRLFLVLEFLNGGELFSRIRAQERLSNDEARLFAAEIALVLEYLHSKSIVYRDLKPENLLIDGGGFIKVADFGFAKIVEDKTRTWTRVGTPEYMAPELIRSEGHGKGVDWWALGVLTFEMLAGYPPFAADTPIEIYDAVLRGEACYPKHFERQPTDLIKKLLSHDLTERLGCMKRGAVDVKLHDWFHCVKWNELLKCQAKPFYVPKAKAADDTSMFDRYPESVETSGRQISADEQRLFRNFAVDIGAHLFKGKLKDGVSIL